MATVVRIPGFSRTALRASNVANRAAPEIRCPAEGGRFADRYARVFVFAPIASYPNNVAIVENSKAIREL